MANFQADRKIEGRELGSDVVNTPGSAYNTKSRCVRPAGKISDHFMVAF